MSVSISLLLFLSPDEELRAPTPDGLRALGIDLKSRMDRAAEAVEKVTWAGGDWVMGTYCLEGHLPGVRTVTEARERLSALGIDPGLFSIFEAPEEDPGRPEVHQDAGPESVHDRSGQVSGPSVRRREEVRRSERRTSSHAEEPQQGRRT
jgi:hypothetical protein